MQGARNRKKRAVAEINVVPYIDVMLVLLVIFIATAPVVMQGVTVDLPQAEAEAMNEDQLTPIICSWTISSSRKPPIALSLPMFWPAT